jgi:hypothetical protein
MTGISCHPDIEVVHGPDDDDPHTREAPGASHFWDGADDVPGIVAQSASFAASLVPLEV